MKSAQRAYEEISHLEPFNREAVLLQQLPQVRYIAKRIHDRLPSHVLLEDLIQAGIVGLMDALQKYDPSKNVQIHAYARFRIRGAILDSLRELDWGPRELRRQARRIEQAHRQLRLELGRNASDEELARELGISLEEYHHLLGDLRGLDLTSLQDDQGEENGEAQIVNVAAESAESDPFQLCEKKELKSLLAEIITELPEREQQVLSLYYFEELTMKEVGAVLGVGESRISQIHSSVLVRLRSRLQDRLRSESFSKVMRAGAGR